MLPWSRSNGSRASVSQQTLSSCCSPLPAATYCSRNSSGWPLGTQTPRTGNSRPCWTCCYRFPIARPPSRALLQAATGSCWSPKWQIVLGIGRWWPKLVQPEISCHVAMLVRLNLLLPLSSSGSSNWILFSLWYENMINLVRLQSTEHQYICLQEVTF